MAWFFSSGVDEKVQQIDKRVADSFDRVKEDTQNIYDWLQYLHEENQSLTAELAEHKRLVEAHKAEIRALRDELRELPLTREAIKKVVDSHYDFEGLIKRIRELEQRLSQVAQRRQAPVREEPVRAAKRNLQEKIVKRITRHSKEYVKGMVLNLVQRYGKVSALQLREMVVEEQGLCSKSSFYRILEELEKEGVLGVISSGREKVYLSEKTARK